MAEVVTVDYADKTQAAQLVELLDEYALDPMGGGEPLSQHARDNLVAGLISTPNAFSLIAYVDGKPAGLSNCLQGFSTFYCKPLLNIHDLAVSPAYRGHGIAMQLLQRVDEIARQRGCCKVTLEVLDGNVAAKAAYQKHGFKGYELDPVMGKAELWQKYL